VPATYTIYEAERITKMAIGYRFIYKQIWIQVLLHMILHYNNSLKLHFIHNHSLFLCCASATQRGSWPPYSWGFLDHTQRCTTVGRTSLDEWSARRRDLYLTTHNTHSRQTSMPSVGFEPTILPGASNHLHNLLRQTLPNIKYWKELGGSDPNSTEPDLGK